MEQLIAAYRQTYFDEAETCKAVDALIAEQQAKLSELQARRSDLSLPFQHKRDEIFEKVRPMVLTLAKSQKFGCGSVTYTKARVTRSWDLDGLDRFAVTEPDVWSKIFPLRKEKVGEPSVTIKVSLEATA